MRIVACRVLVAALLTVSPTLVSAQVTRVSSEQQQQRGQFVDGILRTLVDSQMNFGPGQPLAPVPQDNLTPQMQRAQRSLQTFANEAGQLITALRYEERYSTYIRGLLGDALRVKATADVLVNRSRGLTDVNQLATEYAELDRQWRLLSHQLQQTANLSNTVMQRVERLNRANDDLAQQLQVTPQMERDQLVYFFAALGEDLGNLSEDIRIDLYAHPQRDELTRSALQLRTRSQQLRLAVERQYPYQDIVNYYQQFHSEWLPAKGELRGVNNRYIQRNLSRITQLNDRIHELLFLPPLIDGRDILYQADSLRQQLDTVGEQVSLQQLIQLPNATEIFTKSKEFYTICRDFRESVATETQLDNLRWDFRVLDVAWTDLKAQLNPVASPETRQNILVIDNSVAQLRHSLGLQSTLDFNEAIELAANLDNLSDLLTSDISRFVGRSGQFSSQFRTQAGQLSQNFQQTAGALHQSLRQQGSEQVVQQQSRRLAQQWNDLQSFLARIPADQRAELSRTSQAISPVMAKLQVMYGY